MASKVDVLIEILSSKYKEEGTESIELEMRVEKASDGYIKFFAVPKPCPEGLTGEYLIADVVGNPLDKAEKDSRTDSIEWNLRYEGDNVLEYFLGEDAPALPADAVFKIVAGFMHYVRKLDNRLDPEYGCVRVDKIAGKDVTLKQLEKLAALTKNAYSDFDIINLGQN